MFHTVDELLDLDQQRFTHTIVDRRSYATRSHRKRVRDVKTITALVLHQTAFSRGNHRTKYDNIPVHYVILPDGTILQLHPVSAYLWSSNGFNPRSVAVEFVGNFPNTRGICWSPKEHGCHRLTASQVASGRFLVESLIDTLGIKQILAHRQSSAMRENDPGPDVWCQVGQWAIDRHRLSDGGRGFKIGTGNPIPDAWRTACSR